MKDNERQLLERFCAKWDDLTPSPTCVVIVAHPDDESVSLGARLPRLRNAVFAHVTDGSPHNLYDASNYGFATREEYAAARKREVAAGFALAGIGMEQTREIGFVDQEAAHNLVELTHRIVSLLRDIQPEIVVTHPYEGGHPDHDATAFGVHAACALLQRENAPVPVIIEATSYHNGWYGIDTTTFLENGCPDETATEADGAAGSPYEFITLTLSEEEQEFKKRLIACFPTQQGTLSLFGTEAERFRIAPRYDFSAVPHDGQLFYDGFNWNLTGARFVALARDALKTLGLSSCL